MPAKRKRKRSVSPAQSAAGASGSGQQDNQVSRSYDPAEASEDNAQLKDSKKTRVELS
ncbi:hypothetical protein V8C86DRAFT_3137750 [Haematococcus lacustris]